VSLPAGGNFKLTYKYKSYAYKTLDINTTNLEGYDEKIFDINFDLSEPAVVAEIKKDTVIAAVTVVEPVKDPIKPEVITKTPVLKPNSTLQEKIKYYSELYGEVSAEGLQFRVQIAAYKYPKNYAYNHLKGLGTVENLLLDDGITRITIGGDFNTLGKAFEHNLKVIKAGQKDAFVTVLYKGKRIYLEDLEKMGIFVKK
jgi:DNA-directed RNA polymerase subunit L